MAELFEELGGSLIVIQKRPNTFVGSCVFYNDIYLCFFGHVVHLLKMENIKQNCVNYYLHIFFIMSCYFYCKKKIVPNFPEEKY